MNRIEGSVKGEKIDVKRFYLPGIVVHSECPVCNSHKWMQLDVAYLSYPVVGSPEAIHFYCESEMEGPKKYCDAEWTVEVILDISVRLK